jgi:hypothetical protein
VATVPVRSVLLMKPTKVTIDIGIKHHNISVASRHAMVALSNTMSIEHCRIENETWMGH